MSEPFKETNLGVSQAQLVSSLMETHARLATLQARGDRLAEALAVFAKAWEEREYLAEAHWSDFRSAAFALTEWRKGC